MKLLRRLLVAVFLAGAPLSAIAAVTTTSSTELALPSESWGASARAMAMGSAFVAVGGDAAALFWNPAVLSTLSDFQLGLHHNFYLQDFSQDSLAFALPSGPLGSWGLSVGTVGYGALQGRDGNGAATGAVGASQWNGEIAWALSIAPGFSFGLGIKGNLLNLAGTSYSNIAGDAGVLWKINGEFNLGASFENLGTNVNVYPADSVARFGGAYSWTLNSAQRILLAGSVAWEPQGITRLDFGAEDLINSFLSVRAGYTLPLEPQNLQGLTGLTAGAGFRVQDFDLDYAYNPFGDLGSSQRISLTYHFGGAAPQSQHLSPGLPAAKVAAPAAVPANLKAGTVTVFSTAPAAPTPISTPVVTEKLRLLFSLPENQESSDEGLDKDWDQKVQAEKDAIDKNPKDKAAWNGLGSLYYQKAQKEDAIQCFEQVLRLNPADQKLRDWLEGYKKPSP